MQKVAVQIYWHTFATFQLSSQVCSWGWIDRSECYSNEMSRKWFLWGSVLLVALTATADCRKRKRNFIGKKKSKYSDMMMADDPLFSVEPIAPFETTKIGNCECKCCQPAAGKRNKQVYCCNVRLWDNKFMLYCWVQFIIMLFVLEHTPGNNGVVRRIGHDIAYRLPR